MSLGSETAHSAPSWFVPPGESDFFAWFSLVFIGLAIYGVVTLYAAFDRWAEHQSKGTPLAKTIPTLLTIALLYEIFPLGHFNILLPISAILIALMADWSRFNLHPSFASQSETNQEIAPDAEEVSEASKEVVTEAEKKDPPAAEAAQNV